MGKKKFAAAALDLEYEIFIIYIASFNFIPLTNADVHPFCRPKIASLIAKEASTEIFIEYANFTDIFLPDFAAKLSKYIEINNHAIKLVVGQQLFYGPIYSLEPIELEILKAYIKTNLVNKFKTFAKPTQL